VDIYPAIYQGVRAWLRADTWCAESGYSAEGLQETILSFEDGVKFLLEHEAFDHLWSNHSQIIEIIWFEEHKKWFVRLDNCVDSDSYVSNQHEIHPDELKRLALEVLELTKDEIEKREIFIIP
jgi:hypothetical protein